MAIALVLVFTACGGGDGGGSVYTNTSDGKQITITGLDGKVGDAIINIDGHETEYYVFGDDAISNGSVTVTLKYYYGDGNSFSERGPWTKSGSFYVYLRLEGYSEWYVYTNGKTLAELDISISYNHPIIHPFLLVWNEEELAKLPKFSITDGVTNIPFSKFVKVSP